MKKIIRNGPYDHDYVDKYMYSFLKRCQKCCSEKVIRIPMRESQFANIYEKIKNIEKYKIRLEPTIARSEAKMLNL